MNFKRSERLVDMTALLVQNPHKLFTLKDFTTRYGAAKSSISEDVAILRKTFQHQGLGQVNTYIGVSGGFEYIPLIPRDKQIELVESIIELIDDEKRILPGGYIYISDLIEKPNVLREIGKILASQHPDDDIDYIMTVATKGIPIAQALSYELNVPTLIARKESKVTEGSTVSIKYSSQSNPRLVKNMEIGRESIRPNSKVILVDDFIRGGGTIKGMEQLVNIFDSTVVARYIFCENVDAEKVKPKDIQSLVRIDGQNLQNGIIKVGLGSLFD
ncbi:pur operon repressor [Fastidiosipila sanguinis]|uniref:Pur operon repressor n=1 Tax=Fastidiosipila sanguinis TaxID=236753 RepID=A0A2S0KMX7_9FIRM|nr:pur operon repressor [Fastidiosipila sanguinis]AVM42391.1 pur operon repressor [Fastidiosipila sanguinis]